MRTNNIGVNNENKKVVIWISIIVLIIISTFEMTFGIIYKNSNKQSEIQREEIRRNEKRIETVEKIAIENEKTNAVIINELKNFDKELDEIKELLKRLQK